jgi:hypothetical protein
MDRINEILARLAAIDTELDTATGDALKALVDEARSLQTELDGLRDEAKARQELRSKIAAGAGTPAPKQPGAPAVSAEQRAADDFRNTNRMVISTETAERALTISSGNLVQPTKVDGINDLPGAKVSSILDLIKVENCEGMGSHRVAYTEADADEAANQVEGQAAVAGVLGTYNFVDIKPESVAVIDYISKQAKKQTNLQYASKVNGQALLALRKKAVRVVTTALTTSEINAKMKVGAIGAGTLRQIVLGHGNDDSSVIGGNWLFLTKADLIAFGDVRGTNEKRPLYTITVDESGNTGTISEGGVSARFCINSKLSGLTGSTEEAPGMYYGAPQALELDLFSPYEVTVSKDFAIDKLMDTIVGDVELGAGVIAKNAFTGIYAG